MRNWTFTMNSPLLSIIMSTILNFFVRQYRPTYIPIDRPTDTRGVKKKENIIFFELRIYINVN